jgi:hypothetical protein
MGARTGDAPVTGPEHYREGERLLEHAARMLAEPVGDGAAELLQRRLPPSAWPRFTVSWPSPRRSD